MPGGHGNRYMYYLTGLPGWMRLGFSPGWLGRSATGLGPCANYLMSAQWPTPQAQAYWQDMQAGQAPYPMYGGSGATPYGFAAAPGMMPGGAPYGGGISPEQELDFLKNQADALKTQIDQVNSRIEELEKSEERK